MRYQPINTHFKQRHGIENYPISYVKDKSNNQIVAIFDFNCQELNKLMAEKTSDYLNGVYDSWNTEY